MEFPSFLSFCRRLNIHELSTYKVIPFQIEKISTQLLYLKINPQKHKCVYVHGLMHTLHFVFPMFGRLVRRSRCGMPQVAQDCY